MVGGMHGKGACMVGDVRGRGACLAGETATAGGGTHPTGMHSSSCSFNVLKCPKFKSKVRKCIIRFVCSSIALFVLDLSFS